MNANKDRYTPTGSHIHTHAGAISTKHAHILLTQSCSLSHNVKVVNAFLYIYGYSATESMRFVSLPFLLFLFFLFLFLFFLFFLFFFFFFFFLFKKKKKKKKKEKK